MEKDSAIEMLRLGQVDEWNRYRGDNPKWVPDLSKTEFFHINLMYADLSGANLSESDFSYINLSWADLTHTDLQTAGFYHCSFCGTDFTGSNMIEIDISNCNLNSAVFKNVRLDKATIYSTSLNKTSFIYNSASDQKTVYEVISNSLDEDTKTYVETLNQLARDYKG